MQECLGISINDKFIRYAKVQKENNSFKVNSYGIKFYNSLDLKPAIRQLIQETNSSKDKISVNVKNEKYYFFDLFNLANQTYAQKAIMTEFESFCNENHMNTNALEGRYTYTKEIDSEDKNKVIYIYANKGELEENFSLFQGYNVVSATPDSTALTNIAQVERGKNIIIVNLEDITTITTILDRKIYNIDVLSEGLREAFENINAKENSELKTYEILKNTTIYTMEMQASATTSQNNEYLQYIVPELYKIVQEIVNTMQKYKRIDQIYLTGYGTVINNIDLYFQEYFKESKVEILKPFFINSSNNAGNVNIKDYIEVDAAIAQAIQGLGYGPKTLNFKKSDTMEKLKTFLSMDLSDLKKMKKAPKVKGEKKSLNFNFDFGGKLKYLEKSLISDCVILLIVLIAFCICSSVIKSQLDSNIKKTAEVIQDTDKQSSAADSDDKKIVSKKSDYEKYKENLQNTSSAIENKRSRKNQIPTLLNKIVYTIPQEVQLTEIVDDEKSINNQTVQHITITAQSEKYEQLAYFKAKLKNANVLDNVVSSEGTKDGKLVKITIEGDLKTY